MFCSYIKQFNYIVIKKFSQYTNLYSDYTLTGRFKQSVHNGSAKLAFDVIMGKLTAKFAEKDVSLYVDDRNTEAEAHLILPDANLDVRPSLCLYYGKESIRIEGEVDDK